MKVQNQALQVSFLIHALFFLGVLGLSSLMSPNPRLLVIDFNLEKPVFEDSASTFRSKPEGEKAQTRPASRHSAGAPQQQVPLPAEAPRPVESEPTVLHSTSESTVPTEGPEPKEMQPGLGLDGRTAGVGVPGGSWAVTGPGGGGSGTAGAGEGPERARSKYLNEHFAFIRDKILKNLSYPSLARLRGWQGKVILSFIIDPNGSIKGVRLVQSSGFEVLDRSAVEAVKNSVPFPAPPAEAQIIIPIAYRLN